MKRLSRSALVVDLSWSALVGGDATSQGVAGIRSPGRGKKSE